MTSDGSAYTRFQRALKTRNLSLVIAAAAELPQVGLRDALQVCLLLRDGDPGRYERAAVRWTGRFALEARDVSLEAIDRAVAALGALPERPSDAIASPSCVPSIASCDRFDASTCRPRRKGLVVGDHRGERSGSYRSTPPPVVTRHEQGLRSSQPLGKLSGTLSDKLTHVSKAVPCEVSL